ncbi:MAG: hypothetical protein NTZ79_04555 [Proteobacteria bacterium]|nr:hypothetical protein [Pseudomonadota bacterium]
MGTESAIAFTTGRSYRVLVAAAVWLIVYLAVRYAVDSVGPSHPWAPVVACVPVPAFYWFIWVVQRAVAGTDELGRRIHLEALAAAFAAAMLVLMTLGLLNIPVPLRNVWILLPALYGISVAVVSWRYR